MTADEGLPIEIVTAPTIREPSGLAMSSRNMRLNAEQLATAAIISKVLFDAAKNARSHDPKTLLNAAKLAFECIPDMALEYFEIVVASTFEEVTEWPNEPCVFLVACYLGDVRLIDNVIVP
jgi:pantoate--beta-alanine ligase